MGFLYMAGVKIFKCMRERGKWKDVIDGLGELDIKVFQSRGSADISIVLDGRYENPNFFDGKKILIVDKDFWGPSWNLFQEVLPVYYDKIVDVTDLSAKEKVEKIYDLYIRFCENRY